jgi:UDP-N-acetylglucosamine diphosphorylase/glucosamine-1-phosphate N-acetyltransferase
MNFILFDEDRQNLLPLAYTRPIAEFRCGILTLTEKWEKRIPEGRFSFLTESYLQEKYHFEHDKNKNIYLSGNLLSSDDLVNLVHQLQENEAIYSEEGELLAARSSERLTLASLQSGKYKKKVFKGKAQKVKNLWDLFAFNDEELKKDYELLTKGRTTATLDSTNTVIGKDIFIEEGASVKAAILNSETGPIYIGKNAQVMEGSVVRGGLALCEGAVLKLSSKIYGPTTIGPFSKVGGEVNNSVIFGYSNKGHDGFLGNSVLGEWCNLGADTNVSNLKNNYANIKVWNYKKAGFLDTGRQFCGMIMGDHSKSGINTMFNTATVVGVSANIYGAGFPRSFIPSFSWGGAEKWVVYHFEKAMEVAEKMMERRNVVLTEVDRKLLQAVFEESKVHRKF